MSKLRTTFIMAVGILLAALLVAGPATARDRNDDGIPDRWEKRHDLSLKVDQARRDQDRDGLDNRGEFRSDNDPRSDDSDDDGTEDGDENAGVITAFDGTRLTIDLYGGGTVTGAVDEDTEVECGDECGQDGRDDDDGTPDQGGGNDDDNDDQGGDDDGTADQGGDDDDDRARHGGDGGNSGPGSDSSGHGSGGDDDDGDRDEDCSVADLAVDVVVHEAELDLKSGKAVFEEIELAE